MVMAMSPWEVPFSGRKERSERRVARLTIARIM
jgi:hypothetical protein